MHFKIENAKDKTLSDLKPGAMFIHVDGGATCLLIKTNKANGDVTSCVVLGDSDEWTAQGSYTAAGTELQVKNTARVQQLGLAEPLRLAEV